MKSLSKIIQSKNDPRIYRHIYLPNQLSCLLISDKEADKSAASISVGVGSLEDPKTTPGLAHFLEHMLFLGTEKYPNQSDYKAYLMKNSGSLNAYTASTETVYFFSCSNQAFNGALDRFSQFFIHPLFNEDCTEREMQAVHSEHQKNLINDSWRLMQLIRSSALKHTSYNRFSTGDLTTLKKPGVRDELIEFHKKYYSPNLMKLVLYGNEGIEEIEKKALEYFAPITNQSVEPLKYREMPFTGENLAKIYFVKSIKKMDKIEIVWYVENLTPYFASNPGSYISFLFGHEGKNSLLSYLIDEGLALELSSGSSNEMDLFSTVHVTIKLTNKGLENYKEVCELVFKYLKVLQEKGVQKFVFDEKRYINQLKFDFKEKERPDGYVINLSSNLQIYPVENILNHGYMLEDFQPDLIQRILNQMDIKNMRIYVMSESFKDLESVEPIYGTQYTEKHFDTDIIQRFESPKLLRQKTKKDLDLPIANNFLPKDLSQFIGESTPVPEKILETSQSQLFFKQDKVFQTPKANIYLRMFFRSDRFPFDMKSYISAKIWNELMYNELRETIYLAQMANLNSSLLLHPLGLDMHFTGFNDGLHLFLNEIANKIAYKEQTFEKDQFDNIHHNFLQEYSDFQKGQPISMASHIAKILMEIGPIYHINDLCENIKTLSFGDFQHYVADFFSAIRTEWLALGNIKSENIKETVLQFEKTFSRETLSTNLIPKIQVLDFGLSSSISNYEFKLTELSQKNSACLTIFQDKRTFETSNLLYMWLLADMMREPFFTKLRTEEQLGYMVHVRAAEDRGVCSLQFSVQSERKDPQYLAGRIWNFLEIFKEKIMGLEIAEFEKFKISILLKILEKDLNIFQEGSRYWDQIAKHKYDFKKKETDAKALEKIKIEDFVQFVKELVYQEPKVLEVLVVCQKHEKENEASREDRLKKGVILQSFEKIEDFKKDKKAYEDYYHI